MTHDNMVSTVKRKIQEELVNNYKKLKTWFQVASVRKEASAGQNCIASSPNMKSFLGKSHALLSNRVAQRMRLDCSKEQEFCG